jgi:hypothetical protein
MTAEDRQLVLDEEHLRLLSLLHYVSGGMTLAFGLMFGVWMGFMGAIFATMASESAAPHRQAPPTEFFLIFGLLGLAAIVYGVLELISGRLMSQRRRWLFSFIVSLPRVVLVPYGSMLTIFTLIVLDRRSVKSLYRGGA